ncbi:hypothetical protein [Actinoplanes sp. NPDC026619]|uniref:hypothetical protein n=1 Tax=Actinoplanes sp. NPDC026619 TaxID=3155798 RepID=UPI0033D91364
MRKLRAAITAAVLTVPAVAIIGGSIAPALAAETLPVSAGHLLPIGYVSSVLVDPVHRHVLVSDQEKGKLVATTYAGTVATVREGLPGVSGLALSADSKTLYATLFSAHAIVALDAATLTETARYQLDAAINPEHLTLTAGKLWFGYEGDYEHYDYAGNFGSLDISGDQPVVHLHDSTTDNTSFFQAPYVVSAPGAPGVLLVADGDANSTSRGYAYTYDVSGGTEEGLSSGKVVPDWTLAVDLTPDGKQILANGICSVYRSSVTDISQHAAVYNQECNAVTVAAARDGRVAVGYRNFDDQPDYYVYPAGSQTASATYAVPSTYDAPITDGNNNVFWAPDGSRLFGITYNGKLEYRLWVLDEPEAVIPAIKLSAPASAGRAVPLTVSGTITAAQALPSGTKLSVTRTDLDSPSGTALAATTVDAQGRFSVTDTPPAGGTVTYSVGYAGDETFGATSATANVAVSRVTPPLTLTPSKSVYAYGTTVTFTAHLGNWYQNKTIEIWADPYGADPSRLLTKAVVNSGGNVTASLKLTRDTTLTAKYAGDSHYAPRSTASTVYTKVSVSTAVTKYYKTAKIGGTSYYYFHKKTNPYFTTSMTAYPKRKQQLQVEYYAGGKWRTWTSAYLTLSSAGKSYAELTGSHPVGTHFRVRAAYLDTSSGDNVNYTTYGTYRYFTFAK